MIFVTFLGSMGRRDELKNYRNIGIMAHIDAGKVNRDISFKMFVYKMF